MEVEKTKYKNIFKIKKFLATENLTPVKKFFDEKLIKTEGKEYREFNPFRSKLAAAMLKKISIIPIKEKDKVLYLGASHGYTSSFVSDIIKEDGIVFCIDFAPRVVRDLLFVCEERKNMIPIMADASKPEKYADRTTKVDVIYQDVAQRNQVEILFKNLDFLKPKGYILVAIKARSIDVTKSPQKVYREVEEKIKAELRIIDKKELAPFQKDHIFFVCQKK